MIHVLLTLQPRPGGTLVAELFTPLFFGRVRQLLAPAGVMAVNFFGRPGGNLDAVVCALRSAGFHHVRGFGEQMAGTAPADMGPVEIMIRQRDARHSVVHPLATCCVEASHCCFDCSFCAIQWSN